MENGEQNGERKSIYTPASRSKGDKINTHKPIVFKMNSPFPGNSNRESKALCRGSLRKRLALEGGYHRDINCSRTAMRPNREIHNSWVANGVRQERWDFPQGERAADWATEKITLLKALCRTDLPPLLPQAKA